VKKYPPTASLIGSPNIDILYSVFLLAKDGKREWLFRVHRRYRKVVGGYKHIESDLYSNDSLNDDLDSNLESLLEML
jgi:hypothetical protein